MRYAPTLSEIVSPGRSPISTTTMPAPSSSPIGSPIATRPLDTTVIGSDRPAAEAFVGRDPLDQGRSVPFDRPRRQSVAEHERQVAPVHTRASQRGGGGDRERPAEVGPTDVLVARGRPRTSRRSPPDRSRSVPRPRRRRRTDGARRRAPWHGRGATAAGPRSAGCPPRVPIRHPGRRRARNLADRFRPLGRCRHRARSSAAIRAGVPLGAVRRPRSSTRSIRCSQASNSGAGRRPSTWRTYWASWNDVDW